MTYQEFREIVKVQIRDFLPPNLSNAEISINEVIKNNHVKLYGLIIKDPEERMVPTIYLEPYYQKYEAEMDMGRILQSLVAQYEQSKDRGKDILPFIKSFTIIFLLKSPGDLNLNVNASPFLILS